MEDKSALCALEIIYSAQLSAHANKRWSGLNLHIIDNRIFNYFFR